MGKFPSNVFAIMMCPVFAGWWSFRGATVTRLENVGGGETVAEATTEFNNATKFSSVKLSPRRFSNLSIKSKIDCNLSSHNLSNTAPALGVAFAFFSVG